MNTVHLEPLCTLEVAPPPSDGRAIIHVNVVDSNMAETAVYYAMLAKLDQKDQPTFLAMTGCEFDAGQVAFNGAAMDERAKQFFEDYVDGCGTLIPCDLPKSLW